MAERRMFSKQIIDSDAFLDMPLSTQALYFHLSMRADDDGFINNHKKIMRMIGASDDELKVLIAKKFIISFDSGVVVVKHWRIHNYIQKDRYKRTNYYEEMELLELDENNGYKLDTNCTPRLGEDRLGEDRLGEDRLGKVSLGEDRLEDNMPTSSNLSDDVLRYLNEKAKTNYRKGVPKTLSLINARKKEGFTLEDFKTVIDKKTSQWLNDTKMSLYLRPETLFGTKFEGYLNEIVKNDVDCWEDEVIDAKLED